MSVARRDELADLDIEFLDITPNNMWSVVKTNTQPFGPRDTLCEGTNFSPVVHFPRENGPWVYTFHSEGKGYVICRSNLEKVFEFYTSEDRRPDQHVLEPQCVLPVTFGYENGKRKLVVTPDGTYVLVIECRDGLIWVVNFSKKLFYSLPKKVRNRAFDVQSFDNDLQIVFASRMGEFAAKCSVLNNVQLAEDLSRDMDNRPSMRSLSYIKLLTDRTYMVHSLVYGDMSSICLSPAPGLNSISAERSMIFQMHNKNITGISVFPNESAVRISFWDQNMSENNMLVLDIGPLTFLPLSIHTQSPQHMEVHVDPLGTGAYVLPLGGTKPIRPTRLFFKPTLHRAVGALVENLYTLGNPSDAVKNTRYAIFEKLGPRLLRISTTET